LESLAADGSAPEGRSDHENAVQVHLILVRSGNI